jgi:hypothetical protein
MKPQGAIVKDLIKNIPIPDLDMLCYPTPSLIATAIALGKTESLQRMSPRSDRPCGIIKH